MTAINQKEYLKKYLSKGRDTSKKRKRKKKGAAISDRVKIIDDDVNVEIFNKAVEDDLHGEDAPQIVGVIDERPLELRIDDYRKSDLWTPVGGPTHDATGVSEIVSWNNNSSQLRPQVKRNHKSRWDNSEEGRNKSPPSLIVSSQKRSFASDAGSPVRHASKNVEDADFSPPRRHSRSKTQSPPRKNQRFDEDDYSPPRRTSDASSPEKTRREEDTVPTRRRRQDGSSSPRERRSVDSNRNQRRYFESPPQRNRNNDRRHDEVRSHHRKRPRSKDKSLSHGHTKDLKSKSKTNREDKTTKTMDGKAAGLQKADELARETEVWKRREDDLFDNMPTEVSGRNATAIIRDRRTGKIRDFEKEAEDESKRKEREAENQEKYARWGKGLKQVEEHDEKVSNELHEMSKPLARYADDEDLERYLKEQEREGDPMLDYIRKKKKKKQEIEKKPIKPQYEGEFMPNRYGIRPGYRWDGVDRSNGYEKKWFEVLNSRRACQEEVYKWSTEDM